MARPDFFYWPAENLPHFPRCPGQWPHCPGFLLPAYILSGHQRYKTDPESHFAARFPSKPPCICGRFRNCHIRFQLEPLKWGRPCCIAGIPLHGKDDSHNDQLLPCNYCPCSAVLFRVSLTDRAEGHRNPIQHKHRAQAVTIPTYPPADRFG